MKKLISSALIGTSAMTAFSYLQSGEGIKDFREPKLLNDLIEGAFSGSSDPKISGWMLHYAVGLGFAAAYHLLWEKSVQPGVISGTLMGAINGAIGVGVWSTALKVHPSPPKVDRKAFYRHLIGAHMVFGAFVALGNKVVGSHPIT